MNRNDSSKPTERAGLIVMLRPSRPDSPDSFLGMLYGSDSAGWRICHRDGEELLLEDEIYANPDDAIKPLSELKEGNGPSTLEPQA